MNVEVIQQKIIDENELLKHRSHVSIYSLHVLVIALKNSMGRLRTCLMIYTGLA